MGFQKVYDLGGFKDWAAPAQPIKTAA